MKSLLILSIFPSLVSPILNNPGKAEIELDYSDNLRSLNTIQFRLATLIINKQIINAIL